MRCCDQNTITGFNIQRCDSVQRIRDFEEWITAARARANPKWLMYAEPIHLADSPDQSDMYEYYYVDSVRRLVTWKQNISAELLFQESAYIHDKEHLRRELEAQFWKHVEYFPFEQSLPLSEIQSLCQELRYLCVEAATMEGTVAASIFGNPDTTEKLLRYLSEAVESCGGPADEFTVALFGRIKSTLCHHQFLHMHGFPEARLIRSHSLKVSQMMAQRSVITGNVMFLFPAIVERLKAICVDNIVNAVDVKTFVDDMSYQVNSQITLSGVLMAVDCTIMSIPVLGTLTATKTLCAISFLLGAVSLFVGLLAQRFGERMRSIAFSEFVLNEGIDKIMLIFGLPGICCVISGAFTISAFVAGLLLDPSSSWGTSGAYIVTLVLVSGPFWLSATATFRTGLVYPDDARHL
ncbi:hypothetical protein JVU11DRAFT_3709 [Chiua virens]|nr:hypothetical protein JVU11DRAFT_3709 [Chiua virens]